MKSSTKRSGLIATALVSLLLLSGCSSGEDPAAGGGVGKEDVSAAQAELDEAMAPIDSFDFPTEPVAVPAGLSVVAIPCSYAAEGCVRVVDAVKEASEALGWQYQMIDPAGDPDKMRAAIRTAVQVGADAIFLGAIPPDVVNDDVQAARAAGIKVISTSEPVPDGFADASAESDRIAQGRWNAAYITVATGGTGEVIVVNNPEFPSIVAEHKGFTEGLAELCGKCEVVRQLDFQIANLQTLVPTDFQTILTANPNANAVWTAYDPVAAAILPVVDRTDRTDSLTMVSHNGDPFALDYLKADDTALQATAAYQIEWMTYAAVDQLLRLEAGTLDDDQKVVVTPSKLITAENVSTVPWDGDMDWKSEYLKLWGKA